jgi:hypothetical protein
MPARKTRGRKAAMAAFGIAGSVTGIVVTTFPPEGPFWAYIAYTAVLLSWAAALSLWQGGRVISWYDGLGPARVPATMIGAAVCLVALLLWFQYLPEALPARDTSIRSVGPTVVVQPSQGDTTSEQLTEGNRSQGASVVSENVRRVVILPSEKSLTLPINLSIHTAEPITQVGIRGHVTGLYGKGMIFSSAQSTRWFDRVDALEHFTIGPPLPEGAQVSTETRAMISADFVLEGERWSVLANVGWQPSGFRLLSITHNKQ